MSKSNTSPATQTEQETQAHELAEAGAKLKAMRKQLLERVAAGWFPSRREIQKMSQMKRYWLRKELAPQLEAIGHLAVAVDTTLQAITNLERLSAEHEKDEPVDPFPVDPFPDGSTPSPVAWSELTPELAGWKWALDRAASLLESYFEFDVKDALFDAGRVDDDEDDAGEDDPDDDEEDVAQADAPAVRAELPPAKGRRTG